MFTYNLDPSQRVASIRLQESLDGCITFAVSMSLRPLELGFLIGIAPKRGNDVLPSLSVLSLDVNQASLCCLWLTKGGSRPPKSQV